MNSNSNFNITKVTVDPISQEITNLEINGNTFESGEGPSEEYETMYSAIMLKLLNSDPLDLDNLAVDWDDGKPIIRQVFLDEPLPEYGSQVITTKIYVPVGDGTLRKYYLDDLLYAQTTGECGDLILIVKLGNDYYSVSTGPTTEIPSGSSPWNNIESGVEVQVLKSSII